MAERDIFSRLKRLFSTNTIVRNIGGRKLKVVDTGNLQSNVQTNLVDRYQKLYSNASQVQQYGYNDQLYQQQMRLGLFRDYESMDTDSIVASALDIYSDESTMKNEYGNVLSIETDNNHVMLDATQKMKWLNGYFKRDTLIMTDIQNDKDHLDDYCEECGCEDESVSQNLLMFGYKICASCKTINQRTSI